LRGILFFILLSFSPLLSAQGGDYVAAIEERLAAYNQCMARQNIDRLMDYIYPEFFELVPQDLLREQLEQQNTHPDLDIHYENFRSVEVGELLEAEQKGFAQVRYRYQITLVLSPAAADSENFTAVILEELQNRYGEQFVRYYSATGTIAVQTNKNLLAVRPDDDLEWYFLEYDGRQAELVEGLVPPEIRRALR